MGRYILGPISDFNSHTKLPFTSEMTTTVYDTQILQMSNGNWFVSEQQPNTAEAAPTNDAPTAIPTSGRLPAPISPHT